MECFRVDENGYTGLLSILHRFKDMQPSYVNSDGHELRYWPRFFSIQEGFQ